MSYSFEDVDKILIRHEERLRKTARVSLVIGALLGFTMGVFVAAVILTF